MLFTYFLFYQCASYKNQALVLLEIIFLNVNEIEIKLIFTVTTKSINQKKNFGGLDSKAVTCFFY